MEGHITTLDVIVWENIDAFKTFVNEAAKSFNFMNHHNFRAPSKVMMLHLWMACKDFSKIHCVNQNAPKIARRPGMEIQPPFNS